jgi:hypothetical protein
MDYLYSLLGLKSENSDKFKKPEGYKNVNTSELLKRKK